MPAIQMTMKVSTIGVNDKDEWILDVVCMGPTTTHNHKINVGKSEPTQQAIADAVIASHQVYVAQQAIRLAWVGQEWTQDVEV